MELFETWLRVEREDGAMVNVRLGVFSDEHLAWEAKQRYRGRYPARRIAVWGTTKIVVDQEDEREQEA